MTVELLLTYDVTTQSREGERRLRRVAKVCESLGDRVQNSVFEVRCSPAQLVTLVSQLENIICDHDSIRIYRMERSQLTSVQLLGRPGQPRTPGTRVF